MLDRILLSTVNEDFCYKYFSTNRITLKKYLLLYNIDRNIKIGLSFFIRTVFCTLYKKIAYP